LGTAHLTEAFALDLLDALHGAQQVSHVVIASPDPDVLTWATEHGCEPANDQGLTLNEALIATAPVGNVAFVLADLPCLRAPDIDDVLRHVEQPSFIADTSGTGSTSAFFPLGFPRTPMFGPRSRARHCAAGLLELDVEHLAQLSGHDSAHTCAARWHRDVDTTVDLWDACRIGVGAHTMRAVADGPAL